MQQLTYTPTENPSTNLHGNQQSIYDMHTQRKEIDKMMLIAKKTDVCYDFKNPPSHPWINSLFRLYTNSFSS